MDHPELIDFLKTHTAENYPDRAFDRFLYVSLDSQCMYLIENWEVSNTYVISGAKHGAGSLSGSNKTPLGLHTVCERYGDGVPLGGILKARRYINEVAKIYTDETDVKEDHVTTRILRLKGEEPGKNKGGNVDSYKRFIYIHGTPEEGLLGRPASHGCIRMKNYEVRDLYEVVPEGMAVLILEEG